MCVCLYKKPLCPLPPSQKDFPVAISLYSNERYLISQFPIIIAIHSLLHSTLSTPSCFVVLAHFCFFVPAFLRQYPLWKRKRIVAVSCVSYPILPRTLLFRSPPSGTCLLCSSTTKKGKNREMGIALTINSSESGVKRATDRVFTNPNQGLMA